MLQAALRPPSKPLATHQNPLTKAHSDRKSLASPVDDRQQADLGGYLVVSPYNSLPHLLDLRALEESQRLLAKSLTVLQSVREDYATAPYPQSFNWDAVLDRLKSLLELSQYQWKRQHFYIVVFRSQVPPTTDRTALGALDQKSHVEATKSGGLLKYWFGLPDENGRNLATCAAPRHECTVAIADEKARHMAQLRRRSPRQCWSRAQRCHESDHQYVHRVEARAFEIRDRRWRQGMEHYSVGADDGP